jgi:hypothetical protein
MATPHVTEVGRRLEPVVPDPFVEDLSGVRLDPVRGPAQRRVYGGSRQPPITANDQSVRVSDGTRTRDRRGTTRQAGSRTPVHEKADEPIRRP